MFNKRLLIVFSVITGLFFVVSAIGKLINTEAFSYLIYLYGFPRLRYISPLIVLAELLIGLNLLLLIQPKRYSLYAFVLLIIFTLAFAYAHFKNGVNDCGCMGAILPTKMPPLLSFIRNLILIVFSFFVWIKYPFYKSDTPRWKKYILLVSMALAIFIAGNTFSMPSVFQKKTEQPQFKDKLVQNTELKSFIKTTPDKTYLVYFFSYTCPHCWNSVENLRQFIRMKITDSVIVFGMGEPKDKAYFIKNFQPDFRINEISHDNIIKLTTIYPTAFYIRHDSIKVVLPGALLSPITFRKYFLETDFRLP